jgi:predicted AlkP superfamily phosphohydrolase/phosphomutase
MATHHRPRLTTLIGAIAFLLGSLLSPVAGQQANRAIVLAWDGTVPAFARDMLRQGKLPNLAKLIEGGAIADDVIPVFPSKTAPGFASLITGAPPRITGISGNRVPRAPRGQFTILESLAGFEAAPLAAEPIWSAARRAGKKVVVSHIPTFAGEPVDATVRFSGYTLIAGRDGIVTKNTALSAAEQSWRNSPASDAVPIEINFSVAESRLFGLFIDDPSDPQLGYDTLVIASARDGEAIRAKLKTAPAGIAGELFWSSPVGVKAAGNQDAKCYFRLFDLKPDGTDFFLYHTRPVRDLQIETGLDSTPGPTVLTFVGNGATILFQQGAFGRTIANGGNGGAEARYLETLGFAQHQLMETNRWALEHLPWDLFLAYTPFPDEAEHQWRGYLDTTLTSYDPNLAERIRPFLERAYQSSDEHLGLLLSKRPPDAFFALISDHGLQGFNKRVALNHVLQQGGLLHLDSQGRVDLAKTKAVYPPANNGYLLINSKDRKGGIVGSAERRELVRKIREMFLALRDGGQQIVKDVYDADIDGPTMGIGGEVGGDIYVELTPGYDFDPRIAPSALVSETQPHGTHGANPEQPAIRTLMVFNGPGIQAGQTLTNVHIIDFAPTLARLLGIPTPKDAIGRVLFESLDPRATGEGMLAR